MQEKKAQIEKKLQNMRLNQYAFIAPEKLPFSKEVRDMCEMNSCGRYGTNWQCPPGAGALSDLEKKAKSFAHGLLFNAVYPLQDSYDFEGMMDAKERFTKTCHRVLDAVRGFYTESFVMGAGGCNICPACTYPDDPCRFPDRAIASMEACGIDVYTASQRFGFTYINGLNTVTYFGIVFFGKQEEH